MRNKLFIIGDSFANWPYPKNKHWSNLMSNHYDVKNYGYGGASLTETCLQTTYIKDFVEGDRLVVVLTEVARVDKNIREALWAVSIKSKQKIIDRLRLSRQELYEAAIENENERFHLSTNGDFNMRYSFLLDLYFLINLRERYKEYKPVYVTWNENTDKIARTWIKDLIYIPLEKTKSLNEEGIIKGHPDYHPGIVGNRIWYDIILGRLRHGIM